MSNELMLAFYLILKIRLDFFPSQVCLYELLETHKAVRLFLPGVPSLYGHITP